MPRSVGCEEGAGERRRAAGGAGATAWCTPGKVCVSHLVGGRVTDEGVIFNLNARFSQKNRLHVTALSKALLVIINNRARRMSR